MHTLGWGNPFTISPSTIAQNSNPILYGLSQSFSTFNAVFSATKNNYKKAYILNNPLFCRGNRDSNIIDCTLFNKNANLYEIAKLRFCDFFVSGSLKSFVQLNLEYNLNLSLNSYLRLCGAHLFNKNKLKNREGDAISIADFFSSFKKGSKSCRKILTKKTSKSIDSRKLTTVTTFFLLINLELPDTYTIGNFLSLWNLSYLPNKFREFIFKFYNNKLGINIRTSHFGGGTRDCTFCTLQGYNEIDESFVHLFFECDTVNNIHRVLDTNLFNYTSINIIENKSRWFGCLQMERENTFLRLFFLTVQYYIWCAKLGNFIPTVDFIMGETFILLDNACLANSDLEHCKALINCPLSRNWQNIISLARRW